MAVHDVDVFAQQTSSLQLLPAIGRARRATALVHGGDQPQIFGHRKVVQGDVQRRIMRPEHRRLHAEQRVALMNFQQPLHFTTRMRHLPKWRLPRLGVRLGRAVEKRRANARFKQGVNGRIVVCGRRVVVAPVGKCGGAAVELVQRAH